MKVIINKFPITIKFVFAVILFAFALFVSVMINEGFVKQYISYVAPLLFILEIE